MSGAECCRSILRIWLRICNVVETLLGLGLIGYAAYLAHKEPSTFLYMVIGLGCGMVLVALMGFVAVGGSTKCLLRLYTFLMFVLFALHGTLAILIFFKKQKVIDWIHKYDKNDPNVDNAEHWVEQHITALGIATIVMVASEFLSVFCCIVFSKHVLKSAREEWDENEEEAYSKRRQQPLLASAGGSSSGYRSTSCASNTPHADAVREQMSAKYGGAFTKSSSKRSNEIHYVSVHDSESPA